MNIYLPKSVSKGIGALALLMASGIICGIGALASETSNPSIQLRVLNNELQVGTEAVSPYYLQWRTPDGSWQTWTGDTEIPPEISSVWLRGVFQPAEPTEWEAPAEGVLVSPAAMNYDAASDASWATVAELDESGNLNVLRQDAEDPITISASGLSDDTPTAARNNQASATPHNGRARLILENASTRSTSKWIINDSGLRDSGGQISETPYSSGWEIGGIGDLNNDQVDDILLWNPSTRMVSKWVLTKDCVRDFGGLVYTNPMASGWTISGIADLNGDHVNDILLFNTSTRMISKWILDTNGVRTSGGYVYTQAVAVGWTVAGIADLNGDHIQDILLENQTTRKISKWLLNAEGTRESGGWVYTNAMAAGWSVKGTADLNGDGIDDLLLYNSTTRMVSKWLINESGERESGGWVSTDPLGAGWNISGVTDLNSDGIEDIVLYNYTTRMVSKWIINASGERESGGLIYDSALASGWTVAGCARY